MAVPQPGAQRSFESFVRSIPSTLDGLCRLLIAVVTLLGVIVLVGAIYRRCWYALRDLVLAGALAVGALARRLPRREPLVGIGGLDISLLGKQLSLATWWLIVAGALLVQVTRLTNAISLTGASPEPTPLEPVYALKLAMGYVGFAVPAPGARTAVGVRFHQRHGMAPWLSQDWTASRNSVCRRSS